MTNPRQIAEWRDRFNRSVIEILGPALATQGYQVSLDQVVEEVEPDSYGPFYVGEVAFTKPLPNGRYAHVVIQSTRQSAPQAAGAPDVFYVDLLRMATADPPSWTDGSPRAEAKLRVPRGDASRQSAAGGRGLPPLPLGEGGGEGPSAAPTPRPRSQQGWEFRSADDLRAELHHLIARLLPDAGRSVPPGGTWLDRIEDAAPGTAAG